MYNLENQMLNKYQKVCA